MLIKTSGRPASGRNYHANARLETEPIRLLWRLSRVDKLLDTYHGGSLQFVRSSCAEDGRVLGWGGKFRGWKISWVENFVTRGIVTKITKISTPRKLPAIRYTVLYSDKCVLYTCMYSL